MLSVFIDLTCSERQLCNQLQRNTFFQIFRTKRFMSQWSIDSLISQKVTCRRKMNTARYCNPTRGFTSILELKVLYMQGRTNFFYRTRSDKQKWVRKTKVCIWPSNIWKHVFFFITHTGAGFHFWCNFIEDFCNEIFVVPGSYLNVVWISERRCLSKNNSHTSDTSV